MQSRATILLFRYFASGWLPLLPYLLAYLSYAFLNWPVNPVPGGSFGRAPCLLHVYWTLHAIHVVFLVYALHFWRRKVGAGTTISVASITWRALPWICISLFLLIPGAYLEFPADPWEHLARINKFSDILLVRQHPVWQKASYFSAYSVVTLLPTVHHHSALNLYEMLTGLLLAWNFYRLALAVGLTRETSTAFAVVQVLTFGNSTFSFVRYYGLSSSIFAQIGALAIIRLAVAIVSTGKPNGMDRRTIGVFIGILGATAASLLVYFSHIQGIAIAGTGVLAVVLWRVASQRLSIRLWMFGLALLTAWLALAFLPRNPALDSHLQPEGWINRFYIFNLSEFSSPSFFGIVQILGIFGLANLALGVFLVVRNCLAGWLTLTPLLVLLHPLTAILLADFLTARGGGDAGDIDVFSRLLLGVPTGLATVASWRFLSKVGNSKSWSPIRIVSPAVGLLGLIALVSTPLEYPWFGRLWNSCAKIPPDLSMSSSADRAQQPPPGRAAERRTVLPTSGLGFINSVKQSSTPPFPSQFAQRLYHAPMQQTPALDMERMCEWSDANALLLSSTILLREPRTIVASASTAAMGSRHWLPWEVHLASIGTPEIRAMAEAFGLTVEPFRSSEPIAGSPIDPQPVELYRRLLPALTPSRPPSRLDPILVWQGDSRALSPMSTGVFQARVAPPKPTRHWANLLAIDAAARPRAIYLYCDRFTGEFYFTFFGSNYGPTPAAMLDPSAIHLIEFRWSPQQQELVVDGKLLSRTVLLADPLPVLRTIRVGWIENGDQDYWDAHLEVEQFAIGGPRQALPHHPSRAAE